MAGNSDFWRATAAFKLRFWKQRPIAGGLYSAQFDIGSRGRAFDLDKLLPGKTTNGAVFGAFLGYNWQWSELVLGADLAYQHPSVLQSTADGSVRRIFDTSDNVQHDVTISAQSAFKLIDFAILRGRAGYAFGPLLPYAVVGVAVGRFNDATSVTVTDAITQLPLPGTSLGTFQQLASDGRKNIFAFGVAAGLGIDWAITRAVFLRAEWEFIGFTHVNDVRTNLQLGQL